MMVHFPAVKMAIRSNNFHIRKNNRLTTVTDLLKKKSVAVLMSFFIVYKKACCKMIYKDITNNKTQKNLFSNLLDPVKTLRPKSGQVELPEGAKASHALSVHLYLT